MLVNRNRRLKTPGQTKKARQRLWICVITAVAVGIVPVYASGIGDILLSIVGGLITIVAQFFLALLELIANLFLNAMKIDLRNLESIGFLRGFEGFATGIRILAVGIGAIIMMWQLFSLFWGPMSGMKQTQSVGSIIGRGLIFIPLSYAIQPITKMVLIQLQEIYSAFLEVYNANPGGIFSYRSLSAYITIERLEAMGIDIASSGVAAPLQDAAAILIACLLIIIITWNFIKLLLEMTQRFVALLIYVYLSPLACACGVGANTIQITKNAVSLFLSSGVLWILNVWCVGVGMSLFSAIDSAIGGVQTFFLWSVITYGYFKVVQQLDDIFSAVGASNVRFSGSMLDDLLSLNRFAKSFAGIGAAVGGLRRAAKEYSEKGLFAVQGSSSESPLMPQTGKISGLARGAGNAGNSAKSAGENGIFTSKGPGTATQSTNAGKNGQNTGAFTGPNIPKPNMKTTSTGNAPQNFGQQFISGAKAVAGATIAGRLVKGTAKTAENIQARMDSSKQENKLAEDNKSLGRMYDSLSAPTVQARNERMKTMAKEHPEVLTNDAVKEYMGQTLGLDNGQEVKSLSVNEDGILSAGVLSTNADGSVAMSHIEDAGERSAIVARGQGEPVTPAKFKAGELDSLGNDSVRVSFNSLDGSTQTGQLVKEGSWNEDGSISSYRFISDADGDHSVQLRAPADMSAAEVGSVLAGTASRQQVEEFTKGGGDRMSAISSMNINTEAPGTVTVGSEMMNSDDTSISMRGFERGETLTISKSGSDGEHDSWVARVDGEDYGEFEFEKGTGAREVAHRFIHGDDERIAAVREAAGIDDLPSQAQVIFTPKEANRGVSTFRTAIETESLDMAHAGSEFTFNRVDESGNVSVSKGFFIPTGHTDESGNPEYQYGSDNIIKGVVNVNADITPEILAAAIAHKDGMNIEGVRIARENLGIKDALSDSETMTLKDALVKARQARRGTEQNPVGAEK